MTTTIPILVRVSAGETNAQTHHATLDVETRGVQLLGETMFVLTPYEAAKVVETLRHFPDALFNIDITVQKVTALTSEAK